MVNFAARMSLHGAAGIGESDKHLRMECCGAMFRPGYSHPQLSIIELADGRRLIFAVLSYVLHLGPGDGTADGSDAVGGVMLSD